MRADADAELIQASCRGDRSDRADAFAQIIERYRRAVYAVAYSGLRDRALADDITQDTFVFAWRRLDELRDASRLPAWLCGIARNLARDARKRHRRETIGETEAIDGTTPFEQLSEAESERIIAAALGHVPDVYREPLVLYYYEDRSVPDVARSLGISAATTNKRLSRGRRYLADCVATVERGLVRHGPRPGLAASVIALIGITATASHVDASPLVKGSTVNKLSIAAIATAALGGAVAIGVTVTHVDAHAGSTINAPTTGEHEQVAAATKPAAAQPTHLAMLLAAHAGPSLLRSSSGGATGNAAGDSTDCATIARHLQELEADTTHGPTDRPDDATAAGCAAHYQTKCETDNWSDRQRSCMLAAGDMINAHLCMAAVAVGDKHPTSIPPTLTCAVIAQHVATTVQSAGMHADVTDLPQQIEAACNTGEWPIALRQCFANASDIATLQVCVIPPT